MHDGLLNVAGVEANVKLIQARLILKHKLLLLTKTTRCYIKFTTAFWTVQAEVEICIHENKNIFPSELSEPLQKSN